MSDASMSPVKRALLEIRELRARLAACDATSAPTPIAIIGMGMRLPGGVTDAASMAQLLWSGRDAIVPIPVDRWDAARLFDADPDAPGRSISMHGGFIEAVDQFDADFFGISPREAVSMDPQQRIMLEISWEALEDAGYASPRLAGSRTGVYLGIGNSDYGRLSFNRPELIDAYAASGASPSVVAGRISYRLGLQGPSLVVDTACSSSLVALHLACQALRLGECDMALAGGINLILSPEPGISFTKAQMMAPDGRCKTFDAAADGYVRGEGAGVVVLRRLPDAQAAGDHILAVVHGSAVNQDGSSNGLTAPNGPAQEAVIRAALAQGGIAPSLVSYVEAHGTGTPLGDPIEMGALEAVFASGRAGADPLYVGSVKTNMGHLEAAAGIAGLIKVVVSLQQEAIPPSLHFRTGNPRIDWHALPIAVATSVAPWRAVEGRRVAGVSSFGFSGTNAHVVVEAPPPVKGAPARTQSHLLPLAALDADALVALAARYASRLAAADDVGPGDICFTAGVGRTHFRHRLGVLADSTQALCEALNAFAEGRTHRAIAHGKPTDEVQPKVAFVFSGQGSQYTGMGLELYETWPVFRESLDRCARVLSPHFDLLALLRGTGPGGSRAIEDTRWAQPAIFAVEYALAALWRSWGVLPTVVMGHSLGEYVASCCAGVIDLDDALSLVCTRGRLSGSLSGGMAAVFAAKEDIAAELASGDGRLSVAAWNGPTHAVLSGERPALDAAIGRLSATGVRCVPLHVSYAAHSPLAETILPAFRTALQAVSFRTPETPIISNVTGRFATEAITHSDYWVDHFRQPVQFARSVETLLGHGITHVIEIGPHPVLLGMLADCLPQKTPALLPSLRRERGDDIDLLESLQRLYVDGAEIAWEGVNAGRGHRRLSLPTYPFRRRRYWLDRPAAPASWVPLQRVLDRQADRVPLDLVVNDYPAIWASLERLTKAHILTVLREGGVFAVAGETLDIDLVLARCGIVATHRRLIGRWLERLVRDGLLVSNERNYIAVAPLPKPDLPALWAEAETRLSQNRPILDYLRNCSGLLAGVLCGRISPLETIFPAGSSDLSRALYERSPIMRYVNGLAAEGLGELIRGAGGTLRILEVGAGTGGTTASLLPMLEPDTSYLFTDVSDLFLDRARERFRDAPGLSFRKFDMDIDSSAQGIADGSFEIIIAANAVHASADLPAVLQRLRRLLAQGGVLMLLESTTDFAWFDMATGLVEGWQHFTDEARRDTPLLSPAEWQRVLSDAGFSAAAAWPHSTSPAAVLGQHLIAARAPGLLIAAPSRQPRPSEAAPIEARPADGPSAARQRILAALPDERTDLLQDFVRRNVMRVLRRADDDPPGLRDRLMDLGVDSLMAVQLRTELGEGLGLQSRLPATLMFDHPTIAGLADVLAAELDESPLSPSTGVERADTASINALDVSAVAALSEAEIEALVLRRMQDEPVS